MTAIVIESRRVARLSGLRDPHRICFEQHGRSEPVIDAPPSDDLCRRSIDGTTKERRNYKRRAPTEISVIKHLCRRLWTGSPTPGRLLRLRAMLPLRPPCAARVFLTVRACRIAGTGRPSVRTLYTPVIVPVRRFTEAPRRACCTPAACLFTCQPPVCLSACLSVTHQQVHPLALKYIFSIYGKHRCSRVP